jgi:two-component system, sensor histidine kinase and response regulator
MDACQMLESMLTDLSFASTVVQSGTAALVELQRAADCTGEDPYRLVLLDWRMPDMDGLETARSIRDCQQSISPEIIMISGYISTDIQAEVEKLGISVYLNKPFNLITLFNGIMSVFGKERMQGKQQNNFGGPGAGRLMQLCDARVLVIEDDKVNQIVAQEILKSFGAEVVTVDNGASAVETVLCNDFDMVFMDIQMPGMNGYEAAVAIRQTKGELELPIIAMTAHAFRDERDRFIQSCSNGCLRRKSEAHRCYRTDPMVEHRSGCCPTSSPVLISLLLYDGAEEARLWRVRLSLVSVIRTATYSMS